MWEISAEFVGRFPVFWWRRAKPTTGRDQRRGFWRLKGEFGRWVSVAEAVCAVTPPSHTHTQPRNPAHKTPAARADTHPQNPNQCPHTHPNIPEPIQPTQIPNPRSSLVVTQPARHMRLGHRLCAPIRVPPHAISRERCVELNRSLRAVLSNMLWMRVSWMSTVRMRLDKGRAGQAYVSHASR